MGHCKQSVRPAGGSGDSRPLGEPSSPPHTSATKEAVSPETPVHSASARDSWFGLHLPTVDPPGSLSFDQEAWAWLLPLQLWEGQLWGLSVPPVGSFPSAPNPIRPLCNNYLGPAPQTDQLRAGLTCKRGETPTQTPGREAPVEPRPKRAL